MPRPIVFLEDEHRSVGHAGRIGGESAPRTEAVNGQRTFGPVEGRVPSHHPLWTPTASSPDREDVALARSCELGPPTVFVAESKDLFELDVGILGRGRGSAGDPPVRAGQPGGQVGPRPHRARLIWPV